MCEIMLARFMSGSARIISAAHTHRKYLAAWLPRRASTILTKKTVSRKAQLV